MRKILCKIFGHNWNVKNIIITSDKQFAYAELHCKRCGIIKHTKPMVIFWTSKP